MAVQLQQFAKETLWRKQVASRLGSASLATTATTGFLYAPSCAGVPTGVPVAVAGMAPIVIDETNHRLYFYSGGAWRNAGP